MCRFDDVTCRILIFQTRSDRWKNFFFVDICFQKTSKLLGQFQQHALQLPRLISYHMKYYNNV